MRKKQLLFIFFLVLIIPSLLPLFKSDFFRMHDYTHVARLAELDEGLKDGHIPPRWSKNLGWGYGMPLFHFYAPLPYYFAELFHLLGFSFVLSIKIVFGLSFFIAFLGMYKFSKKFWGHRAGLLAGLLFVYVPYRAVDFYVRGTLGELFAISLIPWVLWIITDIIDKKNNKKVALGGVILGLFLLSHTVLNLVCFPLFLIFAGVYLLINGVGWKKIKRLILFFILGLGLASFFLLPAFFEKKYTVVRELTTGYGYYGHHFLYLRQFFKGKWGYGGSVGGIDDEMLFKLGEVQIALILLLVFFGLYEILKKKKVSKKNYLSLSLLLLLSLIVFFTTYHAKWIWDFLPIFAYIQFPWRYISFIIVVVSFLAGGAVYYIGKYFKKLVFLFLIVSAGLILFLNVGYFKPEEYSGADDFYYTDKERIKEEMSGVIPDYIPVWVEKFPKKAVKKPYRVISGQAQIKVVKDKTQQLSLNTVSKKPFELQINRFYFPGTKVMLNKKPVKFDYKGNNGIIKLSIPGGNNQVRTVLGRTNIQLASEIISLLSLLIIFVLAV